MSKTAVPKKTPAPKLRFKQFEGAGEWEEKKLGDLSNMSSGGTPPSTKSEYYGGDIPWVSISDMTKSGKYLDRTEKFLTPLGLDNSAAKVFPEKTILFAMYASIGKCNIAKIPVSTSQAILGITPREELEGEYLYYFLANNEIKYADMGQHGTQKNLNAGIVKNFSIPLPPLPEQTHIANCLSSLDAVISAHQSKLEALRQHKRGLMQQLFPQEGETVPRLRFPEFEGAGAWEMKEIKKLGEVVTGNTPDTKKPEYYGGKWHFVSPSDITDAKYVLETKTNLTESGKEQTRVIPAESILFVCIGSTIGKIAKASEESSTNQQINSIVVSKDNDSDFIYYSLELNKDNISALAGRQAVPIINKTLFSSIKIPSTSLPEQKRIAACLSSLDELIAAQVQKIAALQEFKRGRI